MAWLRLITAYEQSLAESGLRLYLAMLVSLIMLSFELAGGRLPVQHSTESEGVPGGGCCRSRPRE